MERAMAMPVSGVAPNMPQGMSQRTTSPVSRTGTQRAADVVRPSRSIPLSVLNRGEQAVVVNVRGRGDLHHHLENLGFVEGARVAVVSAARGDVIVEVKGGQVALNKQTAARIMTALPAS